MKKPDFSKFVQKYEDIKGLIWDKFCNDSGNILLYANVAGYFSSMLSQIWATATNDKLSKKDKTYMLPQDAAEGLTNVVVSLTLGKAIKNYGDWLLETGKKPIDEYREVFKSFGIKSDCKKFSEVLQKAKKFIEDHKNKFPVDYKNEKKPLTFVLENLYAYTKNQELKGIDTIKNNYLNTKIIDTIDDFAKIKGGMGFLTTLCASLLVFCGLSPIIRNKIAGFFASRAETKEKRQNAQMLPCMLKYCTPIYVEKYNFTGLHPFAMRNKTGI